MDCNLDMEGLCARLQNNRCIQKVWFDGIDLRDTEKFNSLAPFLSKNSNLKEVTLMVCNLVPDSINIISKALLNRSQDILERLSLSGNHFSDVDLDQLILALKRSRNLTSLLLNGSEIGLKGVYFSCKTTKESRIKSAIFVS